MDSGISKVKNWFFKEKFTFLLCSLFLYTIAAPFFEGFLPKSFFFRISFVVVLFSAVFAVSSKKSDFILVLAFTFLSLILVCLKIFIDGQFIEIVDNIIKVLFNGCLVLIISRHFYHCEQVTRDTISAALIGYVLLTLLWANLYMLNEIMYPNSFSTAHQTIVADPSILRYFSFVTITTLGYGDISPISSQARHLAISEAFVGQMYVAILVARLVAIHASRTK